MALKTIVQYPHEALRKIAKEVTEEQLKSNEFQQELDNLMETLENEYPLGAGLSGNQINSLYRMFVINMEIDNGQFLKQFFINPEIVSFSTQTDIDWEGCLSFNGPNGTPDQWGQVERATTIKVKFIDRQGRQQEFMASNFYARLIQHETDHLNGILFIDKLESELVNTVELDKILKAETEHAHSKIG